MVVSDISDCCHNIDRLIYGLSGLIMATPLLWPAAVTAGWVFYKKHRYDRAFGYSAGIMVVHVLLILLFSI